MELDILYTTGCKWSKVIYPGYKGVRLPYADGGLTADQLIKDAFTRSNRVHGASPSQHLMNTPFKADAFRGTSFVQKQSLSGIAAHHPNSATKQEFKPFFLDQHQAASEHSSKVLQSLQKRILDSKVSDSKCLFGSANQNTSNEKSTSKKRQILRLPSHEKKISVKRFDLSELEIVHEKANSRAQQQAASE